MTDRTLHPRLRATLALALALGWTAPAIAQEPSAEAPEAEAPAEATATPAEAPDPLAGLSAETVIATVDGLEITLGELIAVRQALPQQYQALPPEILKDGLIEQMINQAALAQRARANGFADRADVELTLRNLVNSTLADLYLRETMAAKITEESVAAEYERRFAEAEPEIEIKAAHILVDSRETAQTLRAEIEAGAAFADVAREHGTDGTASRGGDLGWFLASDMVPEFADAAFALEPGVLSEPVETAFGWHLIRVEERRERGAPPIEEVREDIVRGMAEQLQRDVVGEARAAAEIVSSAAEIPPEALLADDLLKPADE
ncbi:MAG: peptidylprolyl isomerase [Pikeienuella sp.]